MNHVFLEIDLNLSNVSVVWTRFWATRKIMYALKLCYSLCMCSCVLHHFSHCGFFATPWTVAHQAPLAVGFCRQECLEWVAMPSSRGSSWSRGQIHISCIASRFFTHWATWEAPWYGFLDKREKKWAKDGKRDWLTIPRPLVTQCIPAMQKASKGCM